MENFQTVSKCSNYDTVAIPIQENRQNPFKTRPGSLIEAEVSADMRSNSKSNVFLRAARSITKTKSVSGNFIVKTTICKSNNKPRAEEKETLKDNIIPAPLLLADTPGPSIMNQNEFS